MSFIWKSPFNKVVRSTEAALGGLLIGIIVGMVVAFFIPHKVGQSQIKEAFSKCGHVENIAEMSILPHGPVIGITCI